MSYVISQLLTEQEVSEVRSALNSSEDWQNGSATLTHKIDHEMKKNSELIQTSDAYKKATSILYRALDRCNDFIDFTVGKTSGPILFSRTPQGGYYKPHFDSSDMGEFSNTLFLSDPDEYSGGELVIMDGNCPRKFKLRAGSMVTYYCGVSHQVNEVISGTREAAVFWTHSKFKNSKQREIYSDLQKALRYMSYTIPDTVEESQKDSCFLVRQAMYSLERYKAEL